MKLPRFCAVVVSGACALALSSCGTDSAGTSAALTTTKQSFVTEVASAITLPLSVHVHATVNGHGLGVSVNGDIAVKGTTVRDVVAHLRADVLLPRGSVTLLLTDGVAYVKAAGLPVPTTSNKPWLKLDLTDRHLPVAKMYESAMSRLDPASLEAAFRATTQLRRVGGGTVNGVATTHYVVSVDTAKLLRELGGHDVMGGHMSAMHGKLPKSFAYDVWLDSSHRPVRIKGTYAGVTVDATFSSWGEPVSVQAPAARLTTPLTF
jgi:hypothetical protein